MTKDELRDSIDGELLDHIEPPFDSLSERIIILVEKYTEALEKERDKWKETASKHQ